MCWERPRDPRNCGGVVPNNIAIDWPKIESLVGFGRLEAPVVFIGMEEGLTSPDTVKQID